MTGLFNMKDKKWIQEITDAVIRGFSLDKDAAKRLLHLNKAYFHDLLYAASEIRRTFKGNSVKTCSIINAKSGHCSEDCSFCAQSVHHKTDLACYDLLNSIKIIRAAQKEDNFSRHFAIVTAGKRLSKTDLQSVQNTVAELKGKQLKQRICASLGLLTENDLLTLKQAGLKRYHHNLEVSRNYYPNMCTTHAYEDRRKTIENARKAGLELCVGGILGLGESEVDRIDLLYEIKSCRPDAVPINFLVPIKGTPLAHKSIMPLWDAVKSIALARFILPDKDIKIGAGRLEVFKDAQHLVFLSGANGMIVGNLLTVKGRTTADDMKVIRDLELQVNA